MAPFLHASLQHLIANTVPFLVLGAIILLRGTRAFTLVLLVSGFLGGIVAARMRYGRRAV